MQIHFANTNNFTNLHSIKSKKESFTGISGKVVKEFDFNELYLNLINKAAKEKKHSYFVKLMLSIFKKDGIINNLGQIILKPIKLIVYSGTKKINLPSLEEIKILLRGGKINDETVKTLEVKSGIARRISTKGLKATGGNLHDINVIGDDDKINISGFTRAKNIISDDCHEIKLSGNAVLNGAEFNKSYSHFSIKDNSIAKNINSNTKTQKIGDFAIVDDHGTLNGYKGYKIVAMKNARTRNFKVQRLETNSNFEGIVRKGTADYMTCTSGYVTKVNINNDAHVLGNSFFTKSTVKNLYAMENARLKDLNCQTGIIEGNAKVVNSEFTDKLILKDGASIQGGKVKDLIVYGNNIKVRNVQITGKLIKITSVKDSNGNLKEVARELDVNSPVIKNYFHLK